MEMSEENERRALTLLQAPITALSFYDSFHPERSGRSVGSRSLGGHALLRKLEARGLVRRVQGSVPSLDTFQAIDTEEIYEPSSEATPAFEPELHVEPDTREVVEVSRRTVGRLAAAPEQPADGELVVDPATGTITRVVRQVLGRAQIPPQAPQRPMADGELVVENGQVVRLRKEVIGPVGALPLQQPPPQQQVPAPQPPPRRDWEAFLASKYPQMLVVQWALSNLAATTDPAEWYRKREVVRVALVKLLLECNPWFRAYGLPEVPVASLTPLQPPPQPAWLPTPSYAPSW